MEKRIGSAAKEMEKDRKIMESLKEHQSQSGDGELDNENDKINAISEKKVTGSARKAKEDSDSEDDVLVLKKKDPLEKDQTDDEVCCWDCYLSEIISVVCREGRVN